MPIDLKPVKSSNIKAVGYDPVNHALRIQFNSDAVHEYESVTPDKHTALMNAPSIGSHFHANIKSAHKSRKVAE